MTVMRAGTRPQRLRHSRKPIFLVPSTCFVWRGRHSFLSQFPHCAPAQVWDLATRSDSTSNERSVCGEHQTATPAIRVAPRWQGELNHLECGDIHTICSHPAVVCTQQACPASADCGGSIVHRDKRGNGVHIMGSVYYTSER